MNRKDFLKAFLHHIIAAAQPHVSNMCFLLSDSVDYRTPSFNNLYMEAMRLGIDPASYDQKELHEIIARKSEDSAECRTTQRTKGGEG
jgi:hypothetical protein